ncbi:MAG TPA: ATP-binding cassette domain-containing protein [Bacteroidota bacterium]|nr:ATP-binding cassette domain-containing protein [Bacteroidota bacterium]
MMVRLSNVTVSFSKQAVLDRVGLEIDAGEFVSLVGTTGSGKSTLLRLLYMDLFPDSGTVTVGKFSSSGITSKQIPLLRRKLGIVFQDFKLLEDRSVYDNVAFSLYVTNVRSTDIKKKVLNVLANVGLSHKRNSMPHQLSGGEQQRVAIARALVNEPILLLADEPTGNLDPSTSLEILRLLKDINAKGTAVLMATHNYDLVRKAQGRIVQIKDRKVFDVKLKH